MRVSRAVLCIYSLMNLPVLAVAMDENTCDVAGYVSAERSAPHADWIGDIAWVSDRVVNAAQRGCYFGEKDQNPWTLDLKKLLTVREEEVDRVQVMRDAVDLLVKHLQSENPTVPHRELLMMDAVIWKEHLSNLKPGQIPVYLGPVNRYTLSGNALLYGDVYDGNIRLAQRCSIADWKVQKESCLTAITEVGTLIRYIHALGAINHFSGDIKDVKAGLDVMDKKWSAYFEEARSQNPLELFVNSRFSPKAGVGEGFAPVPTQQWIVLHPSVAMEYVRDSEDGDQFEEAIVLEMIGINRWNWSTSGDMKRPLGLSLIAAYSDRADVEDLGWGVMAHVNNRYSFGVTKHGGETGFFVSLDVQQFFSEWTDEKKTRFAGYRSFLNRMQPESAGDGE